MVETVKEAVHEALFGMAIEQWTAFWANWWTAIRGASCVFVLGLGTRWMLQAFDEGKVAHLLKYAFLIWALATLAEGCRR